METGDLIFIITIICIVITAIFYFIYAENLYDKDCLKELGKKLCKEMNNEFDSSYNSLNPYFYCKEDIRSADAKRYYFLDYEKEQCRKTKV